MSTATAPAIQIGSHVTPFRKDTIGYANNNARRYFQPRERLEVISLGCGLAICRPEGAEAKDLYSLQVADLDLW